MKQLIVLGNGFDLACGLKSSYLDFFLNRFKKLFADERVITQLEELEPFLNTARNSIVTFIDTNHQNLNQFPGDNNIDMDYFKSYKEKKRKDLTRWDLFFLFSEICIDKKIDKYKWMDVESLIYDVTTLALNGSDKKLKMVYNKNVPFGTKEYSGKELFKNVVYYLSYTGNNTFGEIADELLRELRKFEKEFADYISKQVNLNERDGYIDKAIDLYRGISRLNSSSLEIDVVSVLSFNYSLDERFINYVNDGKLKSWSNIHGIAFAVNPNSQTVIKRKDGYDGNHVVPLPIFGIDNHDIISEDNSNDFQMLFTKSYRVIENNVNGIRNNGGYSEIDLISIYGHSLGRADYSYFEALFDECDLYNSNTKLEYFYYSGKDLTDKIKNKQIAISNMYKLLRDYGSSLKESHGAGIINKLNLENRLSVVPMENLL